MANYTGHRFNVGDIVIVTSNVGRRGSLNENHSFYEVGERIKIIKVLPNNEYRTENANFQQNMCEDQLSMALSPLTATERYEKERLSKWFNSFNEIKPDLMYRGNSTDQCQFWDWGAALDSFASTDSIKKPRKEGIMRKLSRFIKTNLDTNVQALYKLGWIRFEEDELTLTEKGLNEFADFLALTESTTKEAFGKYAQAQVKALEAEEKKNA